MSAVAVVFPGQGVQRVGMASAFRDLAGSPGFAFVDNALLELMWDGPAAALDETLRTQPAVYVAGLLTWEAVRQRQPELRPSAFTGHSLGELTAVAAAGGISYSDGYAVVCERARLMAAAPRGGMTAVTGLPRSVIDDAIDAVHRAGMESLTLAACNSPLQYVASGPLPALAAFEQLVGVGRHGRAVQRLPISIPAHSSLMAGAQEAFASFLQGVPFHDVSVPFVNNHDGNPLLRGEDFRDHLARQICRSVDWVAVARGLEAQGVDHAIELGGEGKLVKLLSRNAPRIGFSAVSE